MDEINITFQNGNKISFVPNASTVRGISSQKIDWIKEIFESEEVKEHKYKLYHEAYEQGRFDEDIDRTNKMGRYREEDKVE